MRATIKTSNALAILAAVLLCVAAPASAGPFLITVDTSPLSGTQTLAFALTNSDPASNTVLLSDFNFGGGNAVTATQDCTLGGTFSGLGCSGDLATSVDLQDLDVVGFFTQQFNPGASLSFVLTATNNFVGSVPDQFAMFLCDATVTTCYSDDPSTGAMLLLDMAGGILSSSSFVVFGAGSQELRAPQVRAAPAVPEPTTALLLGSGVAYFLTRPPHRRRRRRA